MDKKYYFDLEPFAERIAQVITGTLTEDEFTATFPELEYYKVGETIGKDRVVRVDKFMIKDRVVFQVAVTDKGSFSIVKIAQFGDAPTPLQELEGLTIRRNALAQRLVEYQIPNVSVINPETFEPFDETTEEGREVKNLYLGTISEAIRKLDTDISAIRNLL